GADAKANVPAIRRVPQLHGRRALRSLGLDQGFQPADAVGAGVGWHLSRSLGALAQQSSRLLDRHDKALSEHAERFSERRQLSRVSRVEYPTHFLLVFA